MEVKDAEAFVCGASLEGKVGGEIEVRLAEKDSLDVIQEKKQKNFLPSKVGSEEQSNMEAWLQASKLYDVYINEVQIMYIGFDFSDLLFFHTTASCILSFLINMNTDIYDNKSCWYSNNSLLSFPRHESRCRKEERGAGALFLFKINGNAQFEDKKVDVKNGSVQQLTSLRVEGDDEV